ncbi:MAG: hypothetical protein INR62_06790 [Rhodospirillales bacterium]|nr:hypothetical protein [Acetobacter sp.]
MPRLFIQGSGGSIKMDLAGVGVRLSEAVFAHMVADDSLQSIQVCRGDIALIEPVFRRLHVGNLVCLEVDGRPVLYRVRKEGQLWLVGPVSGDPSGSLLLAGQGIQGVVIGFVRLFNTLQPVRYEGTDANYSMNFEVPTPRKKPVRAPLKNPRGRPRLV